MIIGLFKEAIGWFLNLTEVGLAIALLLLIAVAVGMTGFWILSRFMSKLAGPATELDSHEDETDEIADSPPSKLQA
jgi:hypothetical protein